MSHEDDLEEELNKEDDSMIFEDEDDEDEDEWPTEDETDEEDDLDLEDDDDRFDWSKDDDEEYEDEDEEVETMDNLIGKTVATVAYSDPWDLGLTITFTDGTVLNVRERKQAGEIEVDIDGRTVPFENE
jgi:hypothetical protein